MIMPPKKVPKLDGQGQRRLSSFFSNDSDKIGRKIDNTDMTDKCEETSTTSTLSRPATASINENRKFQQKWLTLWPWPVYKRDAMFCKICLKHGKKICHNLGMQNIIWHQQK